MIRVLVDVGLSIGANIDPSYLVVGHPTRGLIGTGVIAPDGTLSDFTDRAMSLQVQRSSTRRVGPVIEYNAGTATVRLLNDDGVLDPATLEAAGLEAPGAVIRIRVKDLTAGITYPIFYGFVDTWLPTLHSATHATVTVTASDALSRLAGRTRGAVAPVGAGEDTGARIARILDSVDWPAGDRDIAAGNTTLQATTLEGDALEEARKAALTEVGELYATASGAIRFRNRHALITDERSQTSQATFGSDTAGGELHYTGTLGLAWDRDQLVNRIAATRAGGVEQTAEDGESITRRGLHSHSETDLLMQTDAEALSWAKHVLAQTKAPEFRVTSMTVDSRLGPAYRVQAFGREIGDRVTVVRRPPGVVDSRDVYVRGISHEWRGADQWTTTWDLQAASRLPYLVIGHPQLGVIGANYIGY